MTTTTRVPAELTAGDTWRFRAAFAGYPPADGWAVTLRVRGTAGGFELIGGADGDAFLFQLAAADSAATVPGTYEWFATAARGVDRTTVGRGRLVVAPDPAATDGLDPLSFWERVLEATRAAILKKATSDQLEFEFAGRKLKRYGMAELVALHKEAERQVAAERQRADQAAGLPGRPSKIFTRFTR